MVINLQFFGGRGASSGISEKGNAYGTQYKILLEYENIKFVTNAGKNYEALMETMTNGTARTPAKTADTHTYIRSAWL